MSLKKLCFIALALIALSYVAVRVERMYVLPSSSLVFLEPSFSWPQLQTKLGFSADDPADPTQVTPTAIVYIRKIEDRNGKTLVTVDPVKITDCQSAQVKETDSCRYALSRYQIQNIPNKTTTYEITSGGDPYILLHEGATAVWKQMRAHYVARALDGERVFDNLAPEYRSVRFWNPDPDQNDTGLSLFYLFADGEVIKNLVQRP